jgi:hypothetical protein
MQFVINIGLSALACIMGSYLRRGDMYSISLWVAGTASSGRSFYLEYHLHARMY